MLAPHNEAIIRGGEPSGVTVTMPFVWESRNAIRAGSYYT